MYKDKPISEYLKELSSKSPIPGGGSAASLVGAIGASLLSKVANFTIGKEKYKNVEKEMRDILRDLEKLREDLERLCSEDAKAYKKLREAFKLPKSQEHNKRIQEALREVTAVPLEVCRNAHEAIKYCMPLAEKGNINLITDVGDACLMLNCAFQAALLNVEINLKTIKDEKFIRQIREVLEPMEKEINAINQGAVREVNKYLEE